MGLIKLIMLHSKWIVVGQVVAALFSASADANPAHDQISSMSEKQRKFYFSAFLVKSGEPCSLGASKVFFQGSDIKGNAFWNVRCIKGDAFVVQVRDDAVGSASILNCKVLKAVAGVECFTKFKR